MLNRSDQPRILEPEQLVVQRPERIKLPNGVPLSVLNAGDNEVTRIDLLMAGGRWQQKQPLQALFTNRMLREGTRRYDAARIAEKLDYYGAWLELSSASEYAYVTLYSLNKYLPQTLDILESIVKEPVFPEKELGVIVDNNIQQFLVNSSKVDFLAHRGLVKALYGGQHPGGRLVQEEDYRRITPAVLREFYDRYYHSNNCSIYLSGKVTGDCIHRIESLFGCEAFGTDFRKPEKTEFHPVTTSGKRIFIERPDALQSAVRMGMLSLDRNHPDYLKARVLVTLFGGYFGSRLMSNIREDKGYTYGISAAIMPYPGQGVLAVSAEAANEFVEPLIGEVYHEIDRLQNELASDGELSMVKNYMLGDMCRSYESAFSLADAWIFVQVSGLQDTYFAEALDAVKEVTPQEIRELAGTAFTLSSSLEVAALLIGIIVFCVFITLVISKVLSVTILKGEQSGFVLELPPYRKPQILKTIVRSLLDRTLFVLGRAVAVAAPAGAIIWILANVHISDVSLLKYCTDFLDPFGRFIGVDGVIIMAFILGFPANETVIPIIIMSYMASGTLVDYSSYDQLFQLLGMNGWTITTAVCTIILCILHYPCSTTCLTIKKETGSLKWTLVSMALPTAMGIVLCMITAGVMRLF